MAHLFWPSDMQWAAIEPRGANYVLGDKGYDADALRALLRAARTVPVNRCLGDRDCVLDSKNYEHRNEQATVSA